MSWNEQETASIGAARDPAGQADDGDATPVGDLAGQTIGDYQIGERIGSGGNGVVYRARQQPLDRDVVVKVLRVRARLGSQSQIAVRFLREAQLASGLDHPYAAHIYDFGVEPDGIMWIAMELVNGTALNRIIYSQGALSLARLVPLLEKICEVVHTAHSHGIVHRDLKPSNIMVLARAGQLLPKLLDFGIARRAMRGPETPASGADEAPPSEREHAPVAPAQAGADDSRPGAAVPADESRSATDLPGAVVSKIVGRRDDTTAPRVSPASLLSSVSHGGDTPTGASMGSPMYMAPEQWRDAAHADERADQYSLGVLTYEALTGRLPFTGKSKRMLAAAHSEMPMPDMGPGFSAELQAVIARATAKDPADRYDDVMAFARAMRAALPVESQGQSVLAIDRALLHQYLERAPQPLADAVAALDTATGRRLAMRAVRQVIRVGFGLLGTVALAAVVRQKTAFDGTGEAGRRASALLGRMRDERMTASDWHALARALVAPFDEQPDAHLLPELVLLLAADRLAEIARHDDPAADLESRSVDELRALLPELDWFLRALAFLCEYPLVVAADGRVELWSGARRAVHPFFILRGEYEPADGEILLTGASREPVLILSPLWERRAPAPLQPAEIFMLYGGGRYGALTIAFPTGFERHTQAIWPWLESAVPGLCAPGAGGQTVDAADEVAPYMGLSAFSRADAQRFFGREVEIEECVNRLRVESFLAVVGPSGAGKSSFVQAGILPALAERHRVVITRPGSRPLAALATGIEELGLSLAASHMAADPDALGDRLRARAEATGAIIVLVVDQFEEVITLCSDAATRRRYAAALMAAVQRASDPVRLIVTLRDDFLLRAQQLGPLSARLSRALVLLATPPPEQLERILRAPAAQAGYQFDDPGLPTRMVEAVAAEPSALALLSFTAAELWERRDRQFRRLQRRDYDELGGVGGALAHHAEGILHDMTDSQRQSVREVFRQLVTADGTRAILTRRELFELLGGSARAQPVLEALIGARLLVAKEGDTAADNPVSEQIEVVHEALLSSWPRLVHWQREDAENARLRDQLRAAARQWRDRGRPGGLLWRGDALMEYRVWRARYPGALTDIEDDFAAASLREHARGLRLRRALWVSALVVMSAVVVVVMSMNRDISAERDRAAAFARAADRHAREAAAFADESRARLVEMQREQGRQALLQGEPTHAFVYLSAALERAGEQAPPQAATRFMLGRAVDALADQQLVIHAHEGNVMAVQFGPDGTWLASGGTDHKARIWDAQTGALRHTLSGHTHNVWSLHISPDGDRLATASWDKTVAVWDVKTGQRLWTGHHDAGLQTVMYSGDGTRLLTVSGGREARVWRADDGELVRALGGHEQTLFTGAIDATGRYVVTGTHGQIARVWEVESGRLLFASKPHGHIVNAVAISPDGALGASASFSGAAQVFPVRGATPSALAVELRGHTDMIMHIAFSPTGDRVITASSDGTVRLWDPVTGEELTTIQAHTGGVNRALFAPDGRRLFTFGKDGTARAWSPDGQSLLWSYIGHKGDLWSADIDAGGTRLLTSGFDGTVRLWDAQKIVPARVWPVENPGPDALLIKHAALAPDGQTVATITEDGTIRLWSQEGQIVRTLPSPGAAEFYHAMRLCWHPDGTRLLGAGGPIAVEWELATGARRQVFDDHGSRVAHALYSPDGSLIVTAGRDGAIRVRDSVSGALRSTLTGHEGPVQFVAFAPGGQRLASVGNDRTVRFWDLAVGREEESLRIDKRQLLHGVDFHPDGTRVVVCSQDKSAQIHAVESGAVILELTGHNSAIRQAGFSPDGQLVATASVDRTLKVWETSSGVLLWSQTHAQAGVPSIGFTGDGRYLLGAFGTRARLWSSTYDERDMAALAAYARCRVDYALQAGRLTRVDLDYRGCGW